MAVEAAVPSRTSGYETVASYKMSSQGISRILYQPEISSLSHASSHQTNSRVKPDLESINELSRTSSNRSEVSLSSPVYIDPDLNFKIVLNLSKEEIELIRSTWKEMIFDTSSTNHSNSFSNTNVHCSITSSLFCIQFYSNLLAMNPDLEKMFPSIKHQAVSFAGVLSTAIHSLENLEKMNGYLSNLGKRHSRILGIDPPHFELMGFALIKTFQDRFNSRFTLELERCWARLFTYLANSILQFGVDPVLKINDNKILNNDLLEHSTTTTLENANTLQINQQRFGSTASLTTKILTPIQTNSSTPSAPLAGSGSKLSKRASKIRKMSEPDEKCVVM